MRFYDFKKKQPRKDELILIKTTNIDKPEYYQIARYKCNNTNDEFQFVIADFKGTEWVMFSRGKTMSWAKPRRASKLKLENEYELERIFWRGLKCR